MRTILCAALLTPAMLAAEPLYTQEGTEPSFAAVQESSGGKPGERFNKGGAPGSRIHVNHELLENQVGKPGPILKDIGLHTEFSGGIKRKEFGQWARWYQEDGNVQVFRLFNEDQNVRSGDDEDASPGRVEVFSKGLTVAPGTWHEYEATYTIIKPVGACIFQLMHDGKDKAGKPLLWPFHIDMTVAGKPESEAKIKELTALLEKARQEYGDTAPLHVANPAPAEWNPLSVKPKAKKKAKTK